jgi:hypothetical protein
MLLFQSPETRQEQINSPWFTEYLLVMAMAKLMDVKKSNITDTWRGLVR